MVNLQSSDAVHLSLSGGGLPVVGITVEAPFQLAAVVISLAVQAPPHQCRRTHEMIVHHCLLDP